jgi:hypothetical protein
MPGAPGQGFAVGLAEPLMRGRRRATGPLHGSPGASVASVDRQVDPDGRSDARYPDMQRAVLGGLRGAEASGRAVVVIAVGGPT